jgi:TrmH family RNA methyltransferase
MRAVGRRGPVATHDGARGRTLRVTTRNSAFQLLESLRTNRQKRHATGLFVVEGVRPITLAIEHGWSFEALAYAPSKRHSQWAAEVIEQQPAATRYELSPSLLAELSGKEDPSELLGIVRMRHVPPSAIEPRPDLLVVVTDRPGNPGNLGTLIRSADALGAHAVVITGHAVDPHEPSALTASRGSFFALPVCMGEPKDVEELLARTRDRYGSCQLVGADESADLEVSACDLRGPTLIVVGNETHGLSRGYKDRCDTLVKIPMTGAASSLNVAVAGSILLYEAHRQRHGSHRRRD